MEAKRVIEEVNRIKENMKLKEKKLLKVSDELNMILLNLPNYPSSDVPIGKNASFNKVIFQSKDLK